MIMVNLEIINRQSGDVKSINCDSYNYEDVLTVFQEDDNEEMVEWIPLEEVKECPVYAKDATPYCEDCKHSIEGGYLALIEAPITCDGCGALVISDI